MMFLLWFRFIIGTLFLLAGMLLFLFEIISVFKLDYVLNRMHAAATGDTLGIALSLIGLMILSGLNFTTLKLLLILIFLWFSSPVSSHLISRLEVETGNTEGKFQELHISAVKENDSEHDNENDNKKAETKKEDKK